MKIEGNFCGRENEKLLEFCWGYLIPFSVLEDSVGNSIKLIENSSKTSNFKSILLKGSFINDVKWKNGIFRSSWFLRHSSRAATLGKSHFCHQKSWKQPSQYLRVSQRLFGYYLLMICYYEDGHKVIFRHITRNFPIELICPSNSLLATRVNWWIWISVDLLIKNIPAWHGVQNTPKIHAFTSHNNNMTPKKPQQK